MKQGDDAAKQIGRVFNLTEFEVEDITRFEKGGGVIFTGDNTIYTKFEGTRKEIDVYFNTDRVLENE